MWYPIHINKLLRCFFKSSSIHSKRVNLQNWEVKEVTPGSSCVSFLPSDEHWQPNSTLLGSSPQRKERLEQNRAPRRASIPFPHNYKKGHLQFLKTNWNVEVALQKWTNKQKEKGRRLFQECASTLTHHEAGRGDTLLTFYSSGIEDCWQHLGWNLEVTLGH